MTNVPHGQQNGQNAQLTPVDAPPMMCRVSLGMYFFGLSLLVFYILIATWPVPGNGQFGFQNFRLFGRLWNANADTRLFITVMAAGALGSLIHTLTSFADYIGNERLAKSWSWWFVLRTPIGIATALALYLALRGALVMPSLPNQPTDQNPNALMNPYGLAAFSALAGLFSKQATDKLREVFDTLFRTKETLERKDPLAPAA